MHGANEGKHDNVPEPGVELRPGTTASAANPSNAGQRVIEIASSEDDASSNEESEGSDDTLSSSDNSSASTSSVEEEQFALAGSGYSTPATLPSPRGGRSGQMHQVVCVGGLVQLNVGKASNVHAVLEIYVKATAVFN